MLFGNKLRAARLAAGLTQEELAVRCGVKKQNISRYENSDREPNIRTAKILADALGVSLENLVLENDKPAPSFGDNLAPDERRLIEDYRSLSGPGREYIRQTMAMAKQTYSEKNDSVSNLETGS